MIKKLTLSLCLVTLMLPGAARADVSVVQEYCEQVTEGSYDLIRIWFSVANFSLPTAICDVHFVAEPQPPAPGCDFQGAGSPAGWAVFLNPFGGADWFANTPEDCVAPGTLKSGFYFDVTDPNFCCYIVQFTNANGEVVWEQEECFNCTIVGAEETSWSTIKALFD